MSILISLWSANKGHNTAKNNTIDWHVKDSKPSKFRSIKRQREVAEVFVLSTTAFNQQLDRHGMKV